MNGRSLEIYKYSSKLQNMASPAHTNGDLSLLAGRGTKSGAIPESIQLQARKVDSPVVNELLVSARKGYMDVVLRLLQGGGAQVAAVADKSPRACARARGSALPADTPAVERCLDVLPYHVAYCGIFFHQHGRNCLHLACLNGHLDTALAIIQTGLLDINVTSKRGLTALHDACNEGHASIVYLLLAMGADIQARTKEGWTCLMGACSNGHVGIAKVLIGAGSDINTTSKLGYTSLHVASWKGQVAVVEMLVREGCNATAQSYDCKTPLQLAQEEEQHECVTILQAVTSRQSEQPEYRIAFLEGQLRLLNDKLVELRTHHDKVLADERAIRGEMIAQLKKEHKAELKLNRQENANLDQKPLTSGESAECPEVKVVPDSSLNIHKRSRKQFKDGDNNDHRTSSQITVGACQRSASLTNLADLESKDAESDASAPVRSDRMSISEMVAESMRNPVTMAAIKRELKVDGLTPKIQRKFAPRPPSTLPSINNAVAGERSPRARGSASTVSKNSDLLQ